MKKYLAIIGVSFLFVGCTTVASNDAYEKSLKARECELSNYEAELNDYERRVVEAEEDSEPIVSDSVGFTIGAGVAALIWYFLG